MSRGRRGGPSAAADAGRAGTGPAVRRVASISIVFIGFALTTVLLPLLLIGGAIVDAIRAAVRGTPPVGTRLVALLWVYLALESAGLAWMAGSWALSGFGIRRSRLAAATYRTQRWWAASVFGAVRRIFRLRVRVRGAGHVAPGPAVYMFRHVSLIDTLLPSVLITSGAGIRLRYVLKAELLADPALDVAGNRIPNVFVERGSTDSGAAARRVGRLADGLGPDEGVLIYPEGTRYRRHRHEAMVRKLEGDPAAHLLAARLRHLHPPRPGGPLALLDKGLDVVFCAHVGLEGFSGPAAVWRGGAVGATVDVSFRRVAAAEIPARQDERYEWLLAQWLLVDEEVGALLGGRAA